LAERWALVTVRDGAVEGLPARAPKILVEDIQVAARTAPKPQGERITARPPVAQPFATHSIPITHRISFSTADLVLGGDEHREAILKSLRRARHRVIIHSTFINEERFLELLPALKTATEQGATVDILWGEDEDAKGVRTTREVIGRLQRKLEVEKMDRLRLHPFSTGSHSKILIADNGDSDGLTAYVGSCNWLQSSFESFDVSVRFRDPRLISDLFDQLAELSRGANGDWLALTSEFVAIASRQRTRPNPTAGRAEATLILAPQHVEALRHARDQATKQIFVAILRLIEEPRNLLTLRANRIRLGV
jgi:cardiolipin synthase A/B